MSDKTCPSCGADVPSVAKRCRECFHDFTAEPVKTGSSAPLIFLGFLALMSVLGATTLGVITSFPVSAPNVLVDGRTSHIISTTQYVSGIKTVRVPFSDVQQVNHIIVGNGFFEVRAVLGDGSEMLLAKAKKSMKGQAEQYADVMGKPFKNIDNSNAGIMKVQEDASE